MLTEPYIDALLADAEIADQIWELWSARLISDDNAAIAWLLLAELGEGNPQSSKGCFNMPSD